MLEMLESLNGAMLSNGTAYKVLIIFEKKSNASLYSYLKSKLLMLGETEISAKNTAALFREAGRKETIPMDLSHASAFLAFANSIARMCIVEEGNAAPQGEIVLGSYLKGGVHERNAVGVEKSTLNLGAILTGLRYGKNIRCNAYRGPAVGKRRKDGRNSSNRRMEPLRRLARPLRGKPL